MRSIFCVIGLSGRLVFGVLMQVCGEETTLFVLVFVFVFVL